MDSTGDVGRFTSITMLTMHDFQLLTLENGRIKLDLPNGVGAGPPYYVSLIGGGYTTHNQELIPWSEGWTAEPSIFCEVIQR